VCISLEKQGAPIKVRLVSARGEGELESELVIDALHRL